MNMSSIPQGAGLDLGYAADNMETLPYEPEGIQAESLGTIEIEDGKCYKKYKYNKWTNQWGFLKGLWSIILENI